MSDEIYFFPDTNLFDECKPLHEIDWSMVARPDQVINLIVCRPIQSEIDHQKDRGFDRVGKRARSASKLFREMLREADNIKIIQVERPRVSIQIRQELEPDKSLESKLNYSRTDDALVGIVSAFKSANPSFEASVLTHDTGPMATAKMVGTAYTEIPDEWLLAPESNPTERELAATRAELVKLQKAEPEFDIRCRYRGQEVDLVEGTIAFYEPLSEVQIEYLIETLKGRFPVRTDFAKAVASGISILDLAMRFGVPTEAQIGRYRSKEYPDWLDEWRKNLKQIHRRFQAQEESSMFRFVTANNGVRSGSNVLVSIGASGSFLVSAPLEYKKDAFSPPPSPPTSEFQGLNMNPFGGGPISYSAPGPFKRSPDAFYYRGRIYEFAAQKFELEADQWRHGIDPEIFAGAFRMDNNDSADLKGLLEFTVRADNLSKAAFLKVPVRLKVGRGDTYSKAQEFVMNFGEFGETE